MSRPDPSVALRLFTPTLVIERTSEWGQRGERYHHGIDLYAPERSPVRAAATGVVVASVPNGAAGYARYGETVRISHADGTETLYAHLYGRLVAEGQYVLGGQTIGYVGTTRGSPADPDARFEYSEPHVHFEVLIGAYPASRGGPDGSGPIRSMNPREWFRAHGAELGADIRRGRLGAVLVTGGALALGLGLLGWLWWRGRSS